MGIKIIMSEVARRLRRALKRPNPYASVDAYAARLGVDSVKLEASTERVLSEDGTVAAIRHVNKSFGDSGPLPLPSTYAYVKDLQARAVIIGRPHRR